jgi:hypothetical protein
MKVNDTKTETGRISPVLDLYQRPFGIHDSIET